jgi:predicted NBD/HSP70 family sugar kinase
MTPPKPATPPLLKDLNERTVLDVIRAQAPISRAEISRQVGISKPTVSMALQSLLDAGLVRETSPRAGGPTYGATFFEPVAEAALVLALDIGARFLRAAICDLEGTVRAREDVSLDGAGAEDVLEAAVALRRRLPEASGLAHAPVDGAVVGVPGVIDTRTGEIRLAENAHELEGRAIEPVLEERLGVPVTAENDVNLAALGEQSRGAGQQVPDFAFLSVGTGLGVGLVLRGELHRGRHGAAGEIDWAFGTGLERPIDPCALALSAFAAALARRRGTETAMTPPYDARTVFACARGRDPLALEVVDEEARRIALHIAPIAAVADVALVVLGGGLGANGDLLLPPVRSILDEQLPYPPRVETSSLGDAAVLTGAMAVGVRVARENVFARRNGTR